MLSQAAVALHGDDPAVSVTVNDRDVTAAFHGDPDRRSLVGLQFALFGKGTLTCGELFGAAA